MTAKRVAIVLSGCGQENGSKITEAASTLIALSEIGADYQIFAPSGLKELKVESFDALALPGSFGTAQVDPDMKRVLEEFYAAQKPIGAMCSAPLLVARVLGAHGITVTIGQDPEAAREISKTGAHHENCAVDDFISDREHRVITTPANRCAQATPDQISAGVSKMVRELVEMA